jgi:uncharacterized Rmd1/YagE family protein
MILMKIMQLKAFSVAIEMDLNKLAVLRGIPKKYTWEEPLVLQGSILKDILETEIQEEQRVYLFSFGSVVFFNFEKEQIEKVLRFLHSNIPGVEIENYSKYSDDYKLKITTDEDTMITDEYMVVKSFNSYMPEIVSTVIAKSVALERVEEKMSTILDSIENVIDKLHKGKKLISNREHGRVVAEIVRYEYNTISYIMILDRPDTTWAMSEAGDMYDALSDFFELADRFEILEKKTKVINRIVNNFTGMSNSIRGLFVEWVIVALILFEIIAPIFKNLFNW